MMAHATDLRTSGYMEVFSCADMANDDGGEDAEWADAVEYAEGG